MRRDFEQKRGLLALLISLLIGVVAVMVFMYKSSHRPPTTSTYFSGDFVRAGGDTLNVAIEMNPAVYRVKGDTVIGHDYSILQNISRRHGVPIKYHPFVPLQKALDALDDGTVDVVVSTIPVTTGLKEKYLMTNPVYLDREILVQLCDSAHEPIRSQMDLGGDTVWIASQSQFRSRLENLADEIGDTIYIQQSPDYSSEALFILVAKGQIRYAVVNERIARDMSSQYPDVDIATPVSFTQFQSWAVSKDRPSLLDSLNQWIESVVRP